LVIGIVTGCAWIFSEAGEQPRKEKHPMISEKVAWSLRENDFDCCWRLQQRELDEQTDRRPQLQALIGDAESFAGKVFAAEWLPANKEHFLKPVKGRGGEPDRLVHRFRPDGKNVDVELVGGEFTITLNVTADSKPAASSEAVLAMYRSLIPGLIRSDNTETPKLVARWVDDSYWIVSKVFAEPDPAGEQLERYTPWTWLESVRMAIDRQGKWLSVSVRRLPDRVDSMPKGGTGRARGSWFDSYVSSVKHDE